MSKDPDFDLEDFLPYRLSIAANTVSRRIANIYAPYGLSRTQWRVMAVLTGAKAMSAQSVSDKTGMDKTTVSRAVGKLLDRALITRCAASSDARATSLSLNTKGRALLSEIIPEVLHHEHALKAKFTDSELDTLTRLLEKFVTSE